ncbi:hypothetical protein SDC9_180103 [bioreactor metagenome]|uniref:Uncharacterized protein n=1 Tax=bioreactor metagenome TaxID=1076179 RepID=A0A645HA08_9ZZZZ
MGLSGFKLPADLNEEHGAVFLADGLFPLVGGQVRKAVLQLLRGDKKHVPVRAEGEGGVSLA